MSLSKPRLPPMHQYSNRKGLCVIFSQEKNREGNGKDVEAIRLVCKMFHIKLLEQPNLTAAKTQEAHEEISKQFEKGKYTYLLKFVLAHGGTDEKGEYFESCKDERIYLRKDFLEHYTSQHFPSLAGCPDITIVQMCRGDQTHLKVEVKGKVQADHVCSASSTPSWVPNEMHKVLWMATIPNCEAYRNTVNGSFFIQQIWKSLRSCPTLSITQLQQTVTKILSERDDADGAMVPPMQSTLAGDFFFRSPNEQVSSAQKRELPVKATTEPPPKRSFSGQAQPTLPRSEMADWGLKHDAVMQLIKDRTSVAKLKEAIMQLGGLLDVFHTWRDGKFNLLFHAVIENNLDAFTLLLNHGADPTQINDRGTNILHLLIKRNLTDWAQLCVKDMSHAQKRKFVNNGQRNGWTPLMSAAENNHLAACKWLVENGADVNFAMDSGWTAMHAASKKGNKDILELLLKNGGDQDIKAVHREFGRNLKVEDVTSDMNILKLLSNHRKTG